MVQCLVQYLVHCLELLKESHLALAWEVAMVIDLEQLKDIVKERLLVFLLVIYLDNWMGHQTVHLMELSLEEL